MMVGLRRSQSRGVGLPGDVGSSLPCSGMIAVELCFIPVFFGRDSDYGLVLISVNFEHVHALRDSLAEKHKPPTPQSAWSHPSQSHIITRRI